MKRYILLGAVFLKLIVWLLGDTFKSYNSKQIWLIFLKLISVCERSYRGIVTLGVATFRNY